MSRRERTDRWKITIFECGEDGVIRFAVSTYDEKISFGIYLQSSSFMGELDSAVPQA